MKKKNTKIPAPKEIEFTIKTYKGKSPKSRKGEYWYVKHDKKRAIYKYDKDIPIDVIIQEFIDVYYKQKKGKRKSTITQKKTEHRKKQLGYVEKIKKQKTIKSQIKKGITETNIESTKKYNHAKITELTKELLKPLVENTEFLEQLVKPENLQKESYRLEYQIQLKNNIGETIGTTKIFGITPQDLLNTLQHEILYNFITSPNYKEDEMTTLLQINGFIDNHVEKIGQVTDFKIKTIFRKG